jgi:alanyl-tRNA synthetase
MLRHLRAALSGCEFPKMKKLSGSEIRRMFLDYFVQQSHREVHSSSLVPANDPTLLFTNAGMNQFKDVFLGLEKRDYSRATTSQKCVRAGGKHNDLENVGFTNRHHTFFEMLGNFSFGDYFKQDAIRFAWELVTSPQWFGLPKERLYATIFKGEGSVPRDAEAYQYWLDMGVPAERIFEMGSKDNFWQMGDTGPCGPCSEIHYDMGIEASDKGDPKCAAGECKFPCECGRYVELWNLVFMQFDRDAGGTLNPLPKPSIDTGAGLERIAAVLQGVVSNYDTDLFTPLTKRAAELTGVSEGAELKKESGGRGAASLRVIADHARAATFLISDGILPANEGRGYVLRKIIRRAIRHGRLLGQNKPFLNEMVFAVSDQMKDAYPELLDSADRVSKVVLAEETRFAHTLNLGLDKLEQDLAPLLEEKKQNPAANVVYSGEKAFKLYDTFGLPLDFMVDAAHDQGIGFDQTGFDHAMNEQRVRAQASWKGANKATASPAFRDLPKSVFEGYRQTESDNCEVLAIIDPKTGQGLQELAPGQTADVVLDHTPFYADAGGQVGDVGWFYSADANTVGAPFKPGFGLSGVVIADVTGCYAPVQGVRAHKVTAKKAICVGDRVNAVVDAFVRNDTQRNHTGTHLLHAALREVLGKHVKQAGSLVSPGHLRFDFSHFTGVEDEELQDIEDLANKEVLKNDKVQVIEDVPIDTAINEYGAMALFGEKYGDKVRVIKIGDFSTELCGGTHTSATGEIGLVKVLRETSVSSGVRRIEAVTGLGSLRHFRADHELEGVARTLVKFGEEPEGSLATALRHEIDAREDEIKRLRKELEQSRMKSAASTMDNIGERVKEIKGIKVLAHRVDNLERSQMRTLVDNLRNKLGSGVVALGSASDGNVSLIVGVTRDVTDKVQAGKVMQQLAQKVGGKGGGRPDLAEGGGPDVSALDGALSDLPSVVDGLVK